MWQRRGRDSAQRIAHAVFRPQYKRDQWGMNRKVGRQAGKTTYLHKEDQSSSSAHSLQATKRVGVVGSKIRMGEAVQSEAQHLHTDTESHPPTAPTMFPGGINGLLVTMPYAADTASQAFAKRIHILAHVSHTSLTMCLRVENSHG